MFWDDTDRNLKIIKIIVWFLFTFYTNFKIIGSKSYKKGTSRITQLIEVISGSLLCGIFRYKINYIISILAMILMISVIFDRTNIKESMIVTMTSLIVNVLVNLFAATLYYIPSRLLSIYNRYFNLCIIIVLRFIILKLIISSKRIKYGVSFFNNKPNSYIDLLILNIVAIILIFIILFENGNVGGFRIDVIGCSLLLLAIILIIFIQKAIEFYYKQKLMIKELNETKSDLEKAKQEIQTLEKENIELSKKNHSFKHQYKSLKHKVDEINKGNNANEETDLNKELDNLSKDIYIAPKNTELSKTGIVEIDDMLNCMKSECDENNINFNLQIIGNIYYMINNLISKEELEILLADHIKDAIIAIKHSDNVNKSILVKLGKMEDFYGLYIYDSGIEFEKETLENLGKMPITTHIDEGGSGMGFMNTFDTLKKNNASLIINQIGKPSKDNFTKVLEFRFDGKNEFKVLDAKN